MDEIGSDQQFTEQAASIFQARVVIYSIFQDQPFIFGDSNPTSSLDVARNPTALGAMRTRTVERHRRTPGQAVRRGWRFRLEDEGVLILLSDSLADPISSR